MAVVAHGVGTDKLFVARLVDVSVTGDVVVVARESEAIRVTADEGCHGKATVAARGTAVNYNQINPSHGSSFLPWLTALHKERADDGGEHSNDELDDGLPSLQVFQDFHNR